MREARNRQGHSSTSHKIAIKKESVNQTADKLKWEKEITRELQLKREEHEFSYQENLNAYKAAMDSWKDTHSKFND